MGGKNRPDRRKKLDVGFARHSKKAYLCCINYTIFYFDFRKENRQKICRDAPDEAILLHQGSTSRRHSAVPRGRFLRDLRRRRDQGQRHSGHHAHAPRQRIGDVRRTGGISLPCHRHLPAEAGAGGRARGHLRAAGGPQAGEGTRQARRDRTGDSGHRAGRQHPGQQGEQLHRVGLFRPADDGRGFSGHLHGRVLCGRGSGQLCRQADLEPPAQGGRLPARLRGPFFRFVRVETLHLPSRRVGLFGGRQPRETLQAVRDQIPQGLRRGPLHQRHFGRRGHSLLPRIHRAPRNGPHRLHCAYRPGRLRVGRQVHDPQPRTLFVERRAREVQFRRRDRPHADADGRPC